MAVITFTGSRNFAWYHHAVAGCTKENDSTGKVILRCPFLIHLLRPLSEIRQWQKEQRKNGKVRLTFSSQGMRDVQARIKRIEPFRKNDGHSGGEQVTGTFMQYAKEVRAYHFHNLATNHRFTIEATPNHPFYSESSHKYVPVSHLSIHDKLVNRYGQKITLLCPAGKTKGCGTPLSNKTPSPVYNLEVKIRHHYFVSTEGMRVHNICPLEEFLIKNMPDRIKYIRGWAYLEMENIEQVLEIFQAMRNLTNDEAYCDVFCLLLVSMKEKKRLRVNGLQLLLNRGSPVEHMRPIKWETEYGQTARTIFSTFGKRVTLRYQISIEVTDVMDAPGSKSIIFMGNHANLFERLPDVEGGISIQRHKMVKLPDTTLHQTEIFTFPSGSTPALVMGKIDGSSLGYVKL